MKFYLPVPPSTNALFVQRQGRRVKTNAYRAWISSAKGRITIGQIGPVLIWFLIPENRRRDIDNYIKPLMDALVTYKAIEDDRCAIVRGICAHWYDGDEVEVTIKVAT